MLFAYAFQNVIIALCAFLAALPSPRITTVMPSICSSSICIQHVHTSSPPPICDLPASFPEPALIGFVMEGKYLWKGTDTITPTSRVFDVSDVWLAHDTGDGTRLFGITDTFASTYCLSLKMRELSCIWFLMALLLTVVADAVSD
ncbi:hypothetical protein FRC03_005589 [Tulasnella sp. 419]|nr:hypothetical protein FRC03_005589 [Tulasnella sp. 419]